MLKKNIILEEIFLDNKKIIFQKKYSLRAKYIRISINWNWDIVLVIPKKSFFQTKKSLEKKALDFLFSKEKWILSHIWKKKLKKEKNSDLTKNCRNHYLENRELARNLCEEKCKYWSEKMKLDYNKISIKNLKTRWWSCSSKKNLNFSYKILFLSETQQNYLIVHELAHLKHMNHSKDFWDFVCETLWSEKFRRYKFFTT